MPDILWSWTQPPRTISWAPFTDISFRVHSHHDKCRWFFGKRARNASVNERHSEPMRERLPTCVIPAPAPPSPRRTAPAARGPPRATRTRARRHSGRASCGRQLPLPPLPGCSSSVCCWGSRCEPIVLAPVTSPRLLCVATMTGAGAALAGPAPTGVPAFTFTAPPLPLSNAVMIHTLPVSRLPPTNPLPITPHTDGWLWQHGRRCGVAVWCLGVGVAAGGF